MDHLILPDQIYTSLSICSGTPMGLESVTFTKDYVVGCFIADCDILKVLLNFVDGQAGHSNSMLSFCLRNSSATLLQYYEFLA